MQLTLPPQTLLPPKAPCAEKQASKTPAANRQGRRANRKHQAASSSSAQLASSYYADYPPNFRDAVDPSDASSDDSNYGFFNSEKAKIATESFLQSVLYRRNYKLLKWEACLERLNKPTSLDEIWSSLVLDPSSTEVAAAFGDISPEMEQWPYTDFEVAPKPDYGQTINVTPPRPRPRPKPADANSRYQRYVEAMDICPGTAGTRLAGKLKSTAYKRTLAAAMYQPNETTCRQVAAETGYSPAKVSRIWKKHGLAPYLFRRFSLTSILDFDNDFWDLAGLYLQPHFGAVVLSCYTASQHRELVRESCRDLKMFAWKRQCLIEKIDARRRYCRQLTPGRLIANINELEQRIGSRTTDSSSMEQQWLEFLTELDHACPEAMSLHVLANKSAINDHGEVLQWLEDHPRVRIHTSIGGASAVCQLEKLLNEIFVEAGARGYLCSINKIEARVCDALAQQSETLPPFYARLSSIDMEKTLDQVQRQWGYPLI